MDGTQRPRTNLVPYPQKTRGRPRTRRTGRRRPESGVSQSHARHALFPCVNFVSQLADVDLEGESSQAQRAMNCVQKKLGHRTVLSSFGELQSWLRLLRKASSPWYYFDLPNPHVADDYFSSEKWSEVEEKVTAGGLPSAVTRFTRTFFGIRTVSITWITPVAQPMSVLNDVSIVHHHLAVGNP